MTGEGTPRSEGAAPRSGTVYRLWAVLLKMESPSGTRPTDGTPLIDEEARARLEIALLLLTCLTGLVDAVCYLKLGHVFTANMTGNAVLLGFAFAGTGAVSITASLTSVAGFLAGSLLGGRLARSLEPERYQWLTTVLVGETILVLAGTLMMLATFGLRDYLVIVALACAMGMQNTTARRLGLPDLTTTVLTQTISALAAETQLSGRPWQAFRRRLVVIAAMLLGALAGALLLRVKSFAPLAVACVLLAGITAPYAMAWRAARQQAALGDTAVPRAGSTAER